MTPFKLVLAFKSLEDQTVLKSFEGIEEYLKKYVEESKYNIEVITINEQCTDVDKLDLVTKQVPDAFVYIDLYNDTFIVRDMFVSIYTDVNNENSKELADSLVDKLIKRISNFDILTYTAHDKSYMNRVRYFPSITINISIDKIEELSTKNIQKCIAKSIYYALADTFTLPQKGLDLIYIATANLNMRAEINKKEYITMVPKGTIVKVLDKCTNVYWKIKVVIDDKEYIGYCVQMYIKPIEKQTYK